MIHAEKTSDDSHELEITTPGTYSFCIDNSFSSITSKMVYLDLGIMREELEFGKDNDSPIEAVFNVYVSTLFFSDTPIFISVYRISAVNSEYQYRHFIAAIIGIISRWAAAYDP